MSGKRVFAWAVALLVIFGVVRFVQSYRNPWGAAVPRAAAPAASASVLSWGFPSCTDKGLCK